MVPQTQTYRRRYIHHPRCFYRTRQQSNKSFVDTIPIEDGLKALSTSDLCQPRSIQQYRPRQNRVNWRIGRSFQKFYPPYGIRWTSLPQPTTTTVRQKDCWTFGWNGRQRTIRPASCTSNHWRRLWVDRPHNYRLRCLFLSSTRRHFWLWTTFREIRTVDENCPRRTWPSDAVRPGYPTRDDRR
jgi:hypothetical protein